MSTETVIKDDLTRLVTDQTKPVSVMIGETVYELDLTDTSLAALQALFGDKDSKPLLRVLMILKDETPKSSGREDPARKEYLAKVRSWCEANGIEVPTRGRINGEIFKKYEASL